MSFPAFGKPKYGNSGSTFTKAIRLKEGTVVKVRILPPMKSLAEEGRWAAYHGRHYGYLGVNVNNPSKPLFKTFRCVERMDFKTKMITQECPECTLIAARKDDKAAQEVELKKQGYDADQIKEAVAPLAGWLKEHNVDRKWHLNVKDSEGVFTTLELTGKTKKKLDAKIMALLTEEGIDAIDPEQGVWFTFKRTGTFLDIDDAVDVEYESVRDPATNRISRTVKLAPLTEADATEALKLKDLSTLVDVITFDQIKELTQCNGDPEEVDAIFANGKVAKREATPAPTAVRTPNLAARFAGTPAPAPAPEADPYEDHVPEEEPLPVQAAAPLTPAPRAAAVPSTASNPGTVDRSAFMSRFGPKR